MSVEVRIEDGTNDEGVAEYQVIVEKFSGYGNRTIRTRFFKTLDEAFVFARSVFGKRQ